MTPGQDGDTWSDDPAWGRGARRPASSGALRRGIVLGGGGVLGFAWMAGALAALEVEADLDARDVDVLVGTSAGSVLAALLACGVSTGQMRRHHQGVPAPEDAPILYDYSRAGRALPPRPRLGVGSPRLVLHALRHPSQLSSLATLSGVLPAGRGSLRPVHDMIAGLVEATRVADGWPSRPRPWVIATDYHTGRRVVFGRDQVGPFGASDISLADAVTASCSIPAWYPPVTIGNRPYVDGGTVSNASVDVLAGAQMDEVFVLAPMASVQSDHPRSPVSRVERAIRRAVTRGIQLDIEALRLEGCRVVLVTPGPEDLAVMGGNLMNPRRRTEVLQTAMRTSAVQLRAQLAARRRRSAHADPERSPA